MRIVALELENTKSYEKGKIDFTDGVNAIVGHNGAGKSTILESIGFALFDCLTGYKQSDFVREGAKSAEIRVTIVSGLDERSYQVVRRCGSSNVHAIHDPDLGTKICEGKADVLHFLRQHMGVDPTADLARLFSDAVGVPQGTFTAAFLQTPAQRKSIFDPLLQVEEYKQAFDKLLDPLRTLQKRQQDLDVEMAGYAGRLERLPVLEQAIAQRAEQLTKMECDLVTTTAQLETAIRERSSLDAIQQRVTTLREHHQQAKQQEATVTVQLQNAEKELVDAKAADATVRENQADHEQYLAGQEQQKRLSAQMQERQTLERQKNALDKQLGVLEATVARLVQELAMVTEAEAQMAMLAPAVVEQERLEVALNDAQQQSTRLADARHQLTTLEENQQRLENRLATVDAQLLQSERLEAERVETERTGDLLRQQIDTNKERLAHFKVEADAIKEQSNALESVETALCPICEQPLTAEHRQTLQARNHERLDSLRAEYRTQQKANKADEEALKSRQSTLKELQRQLRAMPREDEKMTLQQELTSANVAVKSQREQLTHFTDAPERVLALTEALATLGNPRQQHAVAAATADKRTTLETQKDEAAATVTKTQAELSTVNEALREFAMLDTAMAVVAQQLQETEVAHQTVLRHQQVASTLVERTDRVAHLQAEVATATEAVTKATTALAAEAAQFDQERYQTLLADEQQLQNQQNRMQTEFTLLQREQQREQAEQVTLQEQQQLLVGLQQTHEEFRRQIDVLEALRNLLRQAGPYVTKALIKQISDSAGQVFGDIMQDYTRHLSWKEDYGITLEVDGRERQFAQLSGGEQMSAALAVRLALLQEMSNIDIAFFDEPTTNLDETRRDSLARQILDVKGFRQLFVISHDDTFEQATQNLIRIERVNGISTVQQS